MKIKLSIAFLGLFALSACNSGMSLSELKRKELAGSEFQQALAKEYLGYSESEAEQYDWRDSAFFADKGLFVASGQDAEPEKPENWKIDENNINALQNGRSELISVLTDDNKKNKFETLARAQMMYDCWVEQQEENWQTEHISSCRDEFFDLLNKLKKPEPPKPAPQVKNDEITIYVVNFGFDSWKLDGEAKAIVKSVALDAGEKIVQLNVESTGYTDLVGNDKYNLLLSKKRAEAVKRELVKNGFNADKIKTNALGETNPVVKTNKKERQNRRVEIIVKE